MILRTNDGHALRQLGHLLALADGAPRPAFSAPSDWSDLIRCAGVHALAPALWSAARALDLLQPVPESLVEHLRAGPRAHPAAILQDLHEQNVRRTLDLRAQLVELVDGLARHGVVPIALKGMAMVQAGVWPDPADRQMDDIDLLFPDADAAMLARHDLLARGYEEGHATGAGLHHLTPLRHAERFGSFELHIRPVHNRWRRVLPTEEVVASAQPTVLDGRTVLVPSPDVLATNALAHAHLSDTALARAVIPLRPTHEVWRLERQAGPIDWPAVRERFARVQRPQVVERHQRIAAALLDGRRDPVAERSLRPTFVMLRWPALREARDRAWRLRHLFDEDRLRAFYGDGLGPVALRLHHLRSQAGKVRR